MSKENEKELRLKKQMEKNIEAEKRFAKEQRFYQGDEYDLKSQEINPNSLDSVQLIPVDDLDMDDLF